MYFSPAIHKQKILPKWKEKVQEEGFCFVFRMEIELFARLLPPSTEDCKLVVIWLIWLGIHSKQFAVFLGLLLHLLFPLYLL